MVRKRDDGRWEGRVVVGHKANGDSIFRYISAPTQKALLKKLHSSIEQYRDVDLSENSKIPLSDWLDRWLEEYAASAARESTLRGYRQYINNYIKPKLGDKQVCKITTADVQRVYRELQENGRIREDKREDKDLGHELSPSTIRSIHGVLHQAMDAAVREHLTAWNPTEGVTLPKMEAPHRQILSSN